MHSFTSCIVVLMQMPQALSAELDFCTPQCKNQIHCDSHVNTPVKEHTKAINDGLWTTMVGSETNDELKENV